MSGKISSSQVIRRLTENNIPYAELTLQNGVSVFISQLGGRILGPFLDKESESIFWLNDAWGEERAFQKMMASDWNYGGDRLWVGPEIQYLCRNRKDYWNTGFIPPEMDPGHWTLEQAGKDQWRLSQDMTLEAFNLTEGKKELRMEAVINPVPDPLRLLSNYRDLYEGVIYAGYEEVVTLTERQHDDILSTTWNVIQLRPGGNILIPTVPCVEITDYMEPINSSLQTIHPDHVSLRITGNRQYKTGYKSAHVTGRMAYFHHFDRKQAYLIVRNFYNNPSSIYPEEPPEMPGRRGDSIFIYNDDGALGGFGEMECMGQTIGGVTAKSSSTDPMALWIYKGPSKKLRMIISHLLGQY